MIMAKCRVKIKVKYLHEEWRQNKKDDIANLRLKRQQLSITLINIGVRPE